MSADENIYKKFGIPELIIHYCDNVAILVHSVL
jgi:hypothetical protein